jgi:DNA-binding response OmpR family regulator
MSLRHRWAYLADMTEPDQIEHLKWLVDELTTGEPKHEVALRCLTRQQRRIVAMLLKADGETVTKEQLAAAANINRHVDDWHDDNLVAAQISIARKRLKDAGVPLTITATWGVGWWAEFAE